MNLVIEQSDYFWADLQRQVDWYRDNAGSDVAAHYADAVQATLQQLAEAPGKGRLRFWDWPELAGIRCCVGRLDYSFQMVRQLGLKWQDIWVPKHRAS